jgi:hypothetical protein
VGKKVETEFEFSWSIESAPMDSVTWPLPPPKEPAYLCCFGAFPYDEKRN